MVNWGTPDSEKLLAEFLKFDEDPTEGIDHSSTSRRDIVALYTQNLTDFGHFSDNVFVNHYKEVVKKYQEQKAMRGGRVAAVAAAAIPVANSNNGGQGKRDHSIISSSVPPNGINGDGEAIPSVGPKLLPKRIVKNGDTLHGLFAAAPTEMQENMSYYVPIRIAALAGSSPEDLDIEVTHEGWGLTVEYKTPSFYRDAKLISKVEATFAGISTALTSNLHEALARLEIEQPTGIQRHTYKLPMKCKKDVVDFKFFDDGKHQHYRIILEVLDASMAKKVLKIKAEAATGPPPPPNVGSDDSA